MSAMDPKTVITVAKQDEVRTITREELPAALADPDARVWLDLENTGTGGFDALQPALVFHPMAVEDCVTDVNFPRVDDYGPYLYLAVHSARWDDDETGPTIKELDILLGSNYLVTYHEEPTRGITRAYELVCRRGSILSKGPDHLLYLILDVMVDNYMPILEGVQLRVDELEEKILEKPDRRLLAEILRFKRGIAALRRIVGPQRDTILALTRDEYGVIRPEIRPYLRDVYDRLARISDLLDSFRDELATILDIYVSQVSNQLNEVMKVLTLITVIIVPVTLVASIYGMNVVFPGANTRHGWWTAVGLMVFTALGMVWFFRSRKWL
jgi:magnesium transporter